MEEEKWNREDYQNTSVKKFQEYLVEEEKSNATVEKYIRDIQAFMKFADCGEVKKILVMDYKQQLIAEWVCGTFCEFYAGKYQQLFDFHGDWEDCKVKCLKMQHQIYTEEDKELNERRVSALVKGGKRPAAAVSDHRDHLRYRNPGIRTSVFYRGKGCETVKFRFLVKVKTAKSCCLGTCENISWLMPADKKFLRAGFS